MGGALPVYAQVAPSPPGITITTPQLNSRRAASDAQIAILPSFEKPFNMLVGTSETFIAFVKGRPNNAVEWLVRGPACEKQDCGHILVNGLYKAPAAVPNPPDIEVVVRQTITPFASAATRVRILPWDYYWKKKPSPMRTPAQ